jgi:hypothetical protein
MVSEGQIQVETKDQMRARGLPSLDRADALAYAFADVVTLDVAPIDVESHAGESIRGDLMTKA